jgi:UDP-N-acetylglucosamine 2-epimerase (non-hydrolysing)
VFRQFADAEIDHVLVHTGQNYDTRLSDIFFEELTLPRPDVYLGVRADRVGEQIGRIIAGAEDAMLEHRPEALLILGDTNSGLSAIAAARLNIPIFHMEAGNRCFDWSVPEEKNRHLIDHISDWLLPYTPRSREHLVDEGISRERIFVSGNPITDVVDHFRPRWEASPVLDELGLEPGESILVTAHRQETVDVPHRLGALCDGLNLLAEAFGRPIVWSVHPRTRAKLDSQGVTLHDLVRLEEPFGFFDFMALQATAWCVVTDSGTVQEESSLLGVPAVTCRDTTERPETIECGSNVLCGVDDPQRMLAAVDAMVRAPRGWVSPYADDRGVADRVLKYIVSAGPSSVRGPGRPSKLAPRPGSQPTEVSSA